MRVLATFLLFLSTLLFAADAASTTLRGKLIQESGKPPAIDSGGKRIELTGDDPTMKVLEDDRLKDSDFEVVGHLNAQGSFVIDPIHTRSLFVHKDGKRLVVAYWCDVCYIRTYSPGKCWCCQKNTDLDPIEPGHEH